MPRSWESAFGDSRLFRDLSWTFTVTSPGLVVEVDGDVHDLQKEEDERREKVLFAMGLRIVRFRNDQVVKDLSAVVGKIKTLVSESTSSERIIRRQRVRAPECSSITRRLTQWVPPHRLELYIG